MDVFLEWHSDFKLNSTGDLLLVDGDVEVRQRLERRLFTAVRGYVWHQEYGAGLPQKIGTVLSVEDIKAVVNAQIALEASVAPSPAPIITIRADPNQPSNIGIGIQYWDAATGLSVSFSIST